MLLTGYLLYFVSSQTILVHVNMCHCPGPTSKNNQINAGLVYAAAAEQNPTPSGSSAHPYSKVAREVSPTLRARRTPSCTRVLSGEDHALELEAPFPQDFGLLSPQDFGWITLCQCCFPPPPSYSHGPLLSPQISCCGMLISLDDTAV